MSGAYRLSSYYLAKFLADLPFLFMLPTLFWLLAYFLVGFRVRFMAFFRCLMFALLISLCCS